MNNFLQYSPTGNWRILEFWAKFLEFFVEILEFFLKFLEFFSKTLEFYNQGGLFNWNLEFYPSIFSFSPPFHYFQLKVYVNTCYYDKIATILVYFKGKNWLFKLFLSVKISDATTSGGNWQI